jgi:hypothetical protein
MGILPVMMIGIGLDARLGLPFDQLRAAAREAERHGVGRPGIPQDAGYRGLFTQMGFGGELSELEQRRDRGAPMPDLVAAASDEMLAAVGYYGPAGPALIRQAKDGRAAHEGDLQAG